MSGRTTPSGSSLPLVRRFPALGALPFAPLGSFPTPVERVESVAPGLWVKREDLAAEPLGGNKIRALEFLLGGVHPRDRVTTMGSAGSTHVLATALYARRLGARSSVYRWPQEMNDTARLVAAQIEAIADEAPMVRGTAIAYLKTLLSRWRGARSIPAGGSSPLGILGQVNAGLELAEQVAEGRLPAPQRIVAPLGTGGTVAGIVLGLSIGGLRSEVVGVRVVPPIVANAFHVHRLIARTARLLERLTSELLARPDANSVTIRPEFYGGAYGRVTAAGSAAADRFARETGIFVDATYGAKALAAAIALAEKEGGTTLFWVSFDGRWIRNAGPGAPAGVVALA